MARLDSYQYVMDPLKFKAILWPKRRFYNKQLDIIYGVKDADEVAVAAGNELGKDYVAAFIILWFFLTRNPVRIVTTSAKDDHLRVLWGEIGDFIDSSTVPLTVDKGGPLIVTHHEIKKLYKGEICKLSYVRGMVASAETIASMQGHHIANVGDGIARTLFVSDESSSVPDAYYTMAGGWAHKMYYFGNTWQCNNFFKRAFKGDRKTGIRGGDIWNDDKTHCYRKCIKIKAEDSPNVRFGLAEERAGKKPSDSMVIPGVKSYSRYKKHRKLLDAERQCVMLDADWYEGPEQKLFPQPWVRRAYDLSQKIAGKHRVAKAIGMDVAEGGDYSAIAVIDEYGLIKLESMKTPDTSVLPGWLVEMGRFYKVEPEYWMIDRGGGGKQIADLLRAQGKRVRTVSFGEPILPDLKRGMTQFKERVEVREDKMVYTKKRDEMFGELRIALDPNTPGNGFALIEGPDDCYLRLANEMEPIPLTYDSEGRLKLLSKKPKTKDPEEPTLIRLIGHSPDELDALAIAYHCMTHKPQRAVAGAA